MIPPQIIIAGVIATASAATGFGAAWQIQSWRADTVALAHAKQEKQRAEIDLENERLVAKTRTRNDQAVISATNAGITRSVDLRRDADAGRVAVVGLRGEIASTVRDASVSLDACTVRANTLGELFLASTEGYRSLAAAADRHASDIQTLVEAWPK